MTMERSVGIRTVVGTLGRLSDAGLPCLLFGGWAEEALGLTAPRAHKDIDLLLPAKSFRGFDQFLAATNDLEEISSKRFAHKRAFLLEGLMVEALLAQREECGTRCTWFWGDRRFVWLEPLAAPGALQGTTVTCVSGENLQRFRALYREIEPWRWQDPGSLVGSVG